MIFQLRNMINKHIKNKKAQALIESGMMLPIMFFLLIALFDFGRVLVAQWEVNQMTRASIRQAIMTGSTEGESDRGAKDVDEKAAQEISMFLFTLLHPEKKGTVAWKGFAYKGDNSTDINKANGHLGGAKVPPIVAKNCVTVNLMIPQMWKGSQGGRLEVCRTYVGAHSTNYVAE